MRIAYVCHWNLDAEDGVVKKIELQARLWREAGHEVVVFSLAPGEARDRPGVRAFAYGSRLGATRSLARAVRAFRPDVAYLRYDLFLPPVWSLARSVPTVVEVNSDDRIEAERWRGRAAVAYNEVNRRVLLGRARGLVFVTGELRRSRSFARYASRPSTVVANGIELGSEPPAQPANEQPRAIFLGSARQPWHGVDKLVDLARALPALQIDVVGYTPDELERAAPHPPQNVRAHGRLPRARYAPLLHAADVGIGTLALHRKELTEAAPLKVREYLAAGLPVVLAYDDVDLAAAGDPWWLLRLPNREGALDPDAVAAFVAAVRGRRVARGDVEPLVSAQAKERARLAFLERVVPG